MIASNDRQLEYSLAQVAAGWRSSLSNMASKQSRNQPKFTIEDAFEEDADDAIRLYGATNERSPLKPKGRDGNVGAEDVSIRVEDSLSAIGAASGVKGLLTVPDVDVSMYSICLDPLTQGAEATGWNIICVCRYTDALQWMW